MRISCKFWFISVVFLGWSLYADAQTINTTFPHSCGSGEVVFHITGGESCTSPQILNQSSWTVTPSAGVTIRYNQSSSSPVQYNNISVTFTSADIYTISADYSCTDGSTGTAVLMEFQVYAPTLTDLSISSDKTSICADGSESVRFEATPTNGGTSPSYSWRVNGQPVSTENGPVFITSSLSDGDVVSAWMTSSIPCTTPIASDETITISTRAVQTASLNLSAIGGGTNCTEINKAFTLSGQNLGSSAVFRWEVNGNVVEPTGGTQMNVVFYNWPYPDNSEIQCFATTVGACSSPNPVASNILTVPLTPPPVESFSLGISVEPFRYPAIYCSEEVTFVAQASHDANFYWYKNGENVAVGRTYDPVYYHPSDQISLVAHATTSVCLDITTKEASLNKDFFKIDQPLGPVTITSYQKERCQGEGESYAFAVAENAINFTWSLTAGSGSVLASGDRGTSATVDWNAAFAGSASLQVTAHGCNNQTVNDSYTFVVHALPSPIPTQHIESCDFETAELTGPLAGDIVNVQWFHQGNHLANGLSYKLPLLKAGSYLYGAKVVNKYGCASNSISDINVTIHPSSESCSDRLNWMETILYSPDGSGQTEVVSHTKSYFDLRGALRQTQVKNLTHNEILTSSFVKDQFGRVVLETLAAPTNFTTFQYNHWFIMDDEGHLYDHSTLGNPVSSTQGTVGWYYSIGNTKEQFVPITHHPYSRTEFYEDGTGEVKRASGPGDAHRLGTGHERLSGTFPVNQELDEYVRHRKILMGQIEFENGKFQNGSMHPWQNFNPFGSPSMTGFQWAWDGVVIAGGSHTSFSDAGLFGQKRADGLKWPAGDYKIKIRASNFSTEGIEPLESGLSIFVSDDPTSSAQSINSTGDKVLPVGSRKDLIVSFTLDREYEYILFQFYKYGPGSGYMVDIRISEIDLLIAGGIAQMSNDQQENGKGVQSIVRDENGKVGISITDKSGKLVMSARQGTIEEHVSHIENRVVVNPTKPVAYFYILHSQPVIIEGSDSFYVENIVTNERKEQGVTFEEPDGKWPAGFYRILLANTSDQIVFSYSNYYSDISYQFYDDAGRLKQSVSPNGYKDWKNGTDYNLIDKSTYKYNHSGWLLSMVEPDAGATIYKYRRDGKIRFSQNALQKENETTNNGMGRFSYTHYDYLGRPIESGEYKGEDYAFDALSTQLEFQGQVFFSAIDTKDWVKTHYDEPDPDFHTKTNINDLAPEYLRGAVAWTENTNINTWYSYDEFGRVTWMAQKPLALGLVFVTRYEYDFLGNVLKVSNLRYKNGVPEAQFHHHYEYDNDQRLSRAYTSTDGENTKLRATYEYYLHGPLKRIELGDNLQGIDFVYNIHGWLTQINHPDNALDPGQDGNDIFGMVLDYYESDLSNLYQTSSTVPSFQDGINLLTGNRQPLIARHQPLIRFMTFEDEFTEGAFKRYGAQNRAYKTLMKVDHNTTRDN